jgi:hypothetical protein
VEILDTEEGRGSNPRAPTTVVAAQRSVLVFRTVPIQNLRSRKNPAGLLYRTDVRFQFILSLASTEQILANSDGGFSPLPPSSPPPRPGPGRPPHGGGHSHPRVLGAAPAHAVALGGPVAVTSASRVETLRTPQVVKSGHLWPRSIATPPTDAEERAVASQAKKQQRGCPDRRGISVATRRFD